MAKSEMKISKTYRAYFAPYIPTGYFSENSVPKRRHFIDINSIMRGKLGSYAKEDIFFNESPKTRTFEFTGDCYLLTDRVSYSAASSFASTFQCYGMGHIIGQKTGGTKIFRANPITLELPKSKFRIQMSTTKMYTACYNNELEGVTPDVVYSPTIIDRCSDLDTQLIFAVRVIKTARKKRQELQAHGQ